MCLCEIALSIYLWREALGEEVCRALGVGISWWDPHSVLLGVPFWAVLRTAGQGQDPLPGGQRPSPLLSVLHGCAEVNSTLSE